MDDNLMGQGQDSHDHQNTAAKVFQMCARQYGYGCCHAAAEHTLTAFLGVYSE